MGTSGESDVPLTIDGFMQDGINRIGVKWLSFLDKLEGFVSNFLEERKVVCRAEHKFCSFMRFSCPKNVV